MEFPIRIVYRGGESGVLFNMADYAALVTRCSHPPSARAQTPDGIPGCAACVTYPLYQREGGRH